ncbi:MAG: sulfatase-like hydrolase/transferase [Pseudomonadota bacterium]
MKLTLIVALLALSSTLLLFSPTIVYIDNYSAFKVVLWEVVTAGAFMAVAVAALGFIAVTALQRLLPASFRPRIAAAVAALALGAVLQGTYLGWGFGALDGTEVDWSQPLGRSISGVAFWLIPLFVSQMVSDLRTAQTVRAVSLLIIGVQAVLIGVQSAGQVRALNTPIYSVDTSQSMQFSENQNAIVLVLDEFQCDVLDTVLDLHPELAGQLPGFTYFPDAVASSKQTFPSIPTLLTGAFYDNSKPAWNYVADAYDDTSLPGKLRSTGIRSELYPSIPGTVFSSPTVADNSIEQRFEFLNYTRVVYFGMLRSLPVWAKRATVELNDRLEERRGKASSPTDATASAQLDHPKPVLTGDNTSLRDVLPEARVAAQPPTFKFIHLFGLHIPISFDRNLEYVDVEYSRETVVEQALGVVRLLGTFVDTLIEIGVYEDAAIVVVGDHGSGRSPDMWLNPSDPGDEFFNNLKARGCPLFLAKAAGSATEPLQTSDAPVTLSDIEPTLLSEMGVDPELIESKPIGIPGIDGLSGAQSVFTISDNAVRKRAYYSYKWERHEPLYLAPIQEYVITGNVRDDASWKLGRTFLPKGEVAN